MSDQSTHPVPSPDIPEDVLDGRGWVEVEQERESIDRDIVGPFSIEAYLHTKVFKDQSLQARVREDTLGEFDDQLNVFFATRTHLEPEIDNLPLGLGRETLLDVARILARSKFQDRLKTEGIEDVHVVDLDTLETEVGAMAELEKLSGRYNFDSIDVSISGGEHLVLDAGVLDVTGWVGVWHHDGDIFTAGGVYPSEDFERAHFKDLTEAIDVTIDIDLDIWPQPYREEMFSLIRAVE